MTYAEHLGLDLAAVSKVARLARWSFAVIFVVGSLHATIVRMREFGRRKIWWSEHRMLMKKYLAYAIGWYLMIFFLLAAVSSCSLTLQMPQESVEI